MHDFLFAYGLFLAKALTFAVVVIIILVGIGTLLSRRKQKEEGIIEIKDISEKFDALKNDLKAVTLTEAEYKKYLKDEKKAIKQQEKDEKEGKAKKHIFVINFEGDTEASQVESLREIVSAILTVATPHDEVVVKIDSPGGVVHGYGLAASQLHRFRAKKIPLVAIIDKVAASGGYLMACVANKIISAPFAVVGSIGVVAEIPNFHRLLKKYDVDYEQVTAGEYKRTLTVFGENTKEARNKLKEEIQDIHDLFKQHVLNYRPQIDLDKVATGEFWLATQAKELDLVDDIQTSDEYLMAQLDKADIYEVSYSHKMSLSDKLERLIQMSLGKGSAWRMLFK
jgi:serine protease SohB